MYIKKINKRIIDKKDLSNFVAFNQYPWLCIEADWNDIGWMRVCL